MTFTLPTPQELVEREDRTRVETHERAVARALELAKADFEKKALLPRERHEPLTIELGETFTLEALSSAARRFDRALAAAGWTRQHSTHVRISGHDTLAVIW